MRKRIFVLVGLIFSTSLWGMEIEGIAIPETTTVSGKTLQLNGAGIRTKFFFDIYVGALYLSDTATSGAEAMNMTGPKEISMTFLYSEVSQKKLVAAWDEGFRLNMSTDELVPLRERLTQFNNLFVTAHKGDAYIFKFLDDGNTSVTFNGEEAGRIAGSDFQRALLSVWLGEKPADYSLKEAMLGN